jgi:hypothetical protein
MRVNGIMYDAATAGQRNTWNAANSDRVLYGNSTANYNATHATALANCRHHERQVHGVEPRAAPSHRANGAAPKIRPYKLTDGREYFVAFAGLNTFRDLKIDLQTVNKDARPREDAPCRTRSSRTAT